MTAFNQKKFSVTVGSEEYRSNFDRAFGKPEKKDEEERDYTKPDADGFHWYQLPSSAKDDAVYSWRREMNGDILFTKGVYENRLHLECHPEGYTVVIHREEKVSGGSLRVDAVRRLPLDASRTLASVMDDAENLWRQIDRIE